MTAHLPRGVVNATEPDEGTGIYNARIELDVIAPHPRNYKKHPPKQLARICASLIRFGQVKPIVVQAGPDDVFLCVAGHGVREAARLIVEGEYAAPRKRVQQLQALDTRVIPADWSPTDVEGYLIADNLIAEQGEDDDALLAEMLNEQKNAGFDLEALGSSDDELEALFEGITDDFLDENDDDEGKSGDRKRTTDLKDPEGGDVEGQLSVLVECDSEAEQRRAYELLSERGFTCRILTV